MSNKLRSVNTKFWDDTFVLELTVSEKLLFLYLLTNPLSNILGIYEISLKRISFDTGININTILKAFERFGNVNKVFYVDGYVILINFLKNQNLNANMKIGVSKIFNDLPTKIKNSILGTDNENVMNDSEGFGIVLNGLVKYRIQIIEDEIIEDEISKVEENEKFDLIFISDEFKNIWNDWKEYKKTQFKFYYKSDKSEQIAIEQFQKLAKSNPIRAKEIYEYSVANGYKGFFEPKINESNNKPKFAF